MLVECGGSGAMGIFNGSGGCISGWFFGEGGGAVVFAESALGVAVGLVLLQLAVVLLEVQPSALFASAHRKLYQRTLQTSSHQADPDHNNVFLI